MKKILSTTVIALTLFSSSLAAAKTVTIDWEISDTSNVTGYKMYYSYSSNMDTKILACETSTPDITSLSCPNITLTSPVAYFTIAVLTSSGEFESPIEIYDVSLATVQNFMVISPGANLNPTALISSNSTSGTAPASIFFDGTGSSDPDGSIMSYSWDFGDGSTSQETSLNHIYSSPGNYEVKLLVTDDAGATAIDQLAITLTEPSQTTFIHAINFQPAASPVPVDFNIIDSGVYFTSTNGYGWTVNPPIYSADQDNNLSPNQAYDTIIYPNYKSRWEIDLPNGTYSVTVCMGDPDAPTGHQEVQVEGASVINGDLSIDSPWIEKSVTVNLTDGRLTVGFANSTTPKLCWIRVNQ